jgi:hypothetical protein
MEINNNTRYGHIALQKYTYKFGRCRLGARIQTCKVTGVAISDYVRGMLVFFRNEKEPRRLNSLRRNGILYIRWFFYLCSTHETVNQMSRWWCTSAPAPPVAIESELMVDVTEDVVSTPVMMETGHKINDNIYRLCILGRYNMTPNFLHYYCLILFYIVKYTWYIVGGRRMISLLYTTARAVAMLICAPGHLTYFRPCKNYLPPSLATYLHI